MIEKFIEMARDKGFPIQTTKSFCRTYLFESSVYVADYELRAMDQLVEELYSQSSEKGSRSEHESH